MFPEFTLRVEHDFKGGRKLSAPIPLPFTGKHTQQKTQKTVQNKNRDTQKKPERAELRTPGLNNNLNLNLKPI
ncbi:hypothetical protein PWYN_03685 [Paenibacillus wynnii]|uniref:Uncharacterized protein n=1 Tax=Paenibacillus wynnii TaxID=268407 RepID=A0A098MAK5_9BACL|nr:hypothetical protein PWYN_03685 [Paenibacillus wynnii]